MMLFYGRLTARTVRQEWQRFHALRWLSSRVDITKVPMPALSPTMSEGKIVEWMKKPGDSFAPGELLCEVETDKATVGFEMQDDGILAKIVVGEETVKVGDIVAWTVEDQEMYEAYKKSAHEFEEAGESQPSTTDETSTRDGSRSSPPETSSGTNAVLVSPAAQYWIRKEELDASSIEGTGKRGMITKADVILAISAGTAKRLEGKGQTTEQRQASTERYTNRETSTSDSSFTSTSTTATTTSMSSSSSGDEGDYEDIENSSIRRVIAKRLTEAKTTVPHSYGSILCEIDAVMKMRKELKEKHDVKVSVNDFVIKACALALRDNPEMNASWNASEANPSLNSTVDISVAVATPKGLITPIIFGADGLGLSEISAKVKDLALRARDNKLAPEEFQGGTFTISNLGMFGITDFMAVINPPQAGILAIGTGDRHFVPDEETNGIRVATRMTVTLSSDRRVVDEAISSQFLQTFDQYISKPELLLM